MKPLFKKIQIYVLKNRRVFIKHLFLSSLFFFLAAAIVGFRVLYPYHFILSLPFLLYSFRYSVLTILFNTKNLSKSKLLRLIKKYLGRYEKTLYTLILLGVVFYIFNQVIPNDKDPFAEMTREEITTFVERDLDISILHIDRLEITGNELLEGGLLERQEFSADELAQLKSAWDEFLLASRDSESLTDTHRYFSHISYFNQPEEHTKSFVISYALYLKKFEMFGRIINAIGTNKRVTKALNEYSDVFGAKNSYYDVRDRHVQKETFLRRNLGRAYLVFLEKTVDRSAFGEDFEGLLRSSKKSYSYLITNVVVTAEIVAIRLSDNVEDGLFNSWFPIQKNVADVMGKVQVSFRDTPLISREQVLTMKEELQPGDIFIERRNWHLSNVGIPGFWPHAALYLGTHEETDAFFADVFPREGYASFSALVQDRAPNFFAKYQTNDSVGDSYAVIEGQAPGIILLSLEESAMADYVAVLRPRISKESIFLAVVKAIGNYGKPYDYNFDFETRDEIVCSELVYDAYLPGAHKEGLDLPLSIRSGRMMISPNDMAEKFYNEYGTDKQELDLVYFIDGNEELKKAFVKDVNAFLPSWTRSKFSSLLE